MVADAVAEATAFDTLLDEIVEHGGGSILAGKVFEKPYPHLIFENFFPDSLYRRLIGHWPDLDRYVDLNGARTRKQYTLWDRRVEAGDSERTALWRTVSDAVSAEPILDALRERLTRGFEIRAKGSGEGWPVPMYPQPVLYADFDGYAIKPHPDTRRKVLTMMIYMPEDESQRELGTTVYKISPMGVFAWKTYGLVKEKSAPSCRIPASPSSSSIRRTASCARAGTAATPSRSTSQAEDDAPQHILRQAAEGGRGRERVSLSAGAGYEPLRRRAAPR